MHRFRYLLMVLSCVALFACAWCAVQLEPVVIASDGPAIRTTVPFVSYEDVQRGLNNGTVTLIRPTFDRYSDVVIGRNGQGFATAPLFDSQFRAISELANALHRDVVRSVSSDPPAVAAFAAEIASAPRSSWSSPAYLPYSIGLVVLFVLMVALMPGAEGPFAGEPKPAPAGA